MLFQKAKGHVARGDKLILGGLQAEGGSEFFHIVAAAFGGVVGDIAGLAADAVNVGQQLGAALVQGVANRQGAVDIKQKQFFLFQVFQWFHKHQYSISRREPQPYFCFRTRQGALFQEERRYDKEGSQTEGG